MRTLIIGTGYIGRRLAEVLLDAGHEVWGMQRNESVAHDLEQSGIHSIVGDLTDPQALERVNERFDWVINAVSSSRGGIDQYRRVFLDGTRNLLGWLAQRPPERLLFTGSTSVYGQNDGSTVTEASPTAPEGETGNVLTEVECRLREAFESRGLPTLRVRIGAIYGPGRGYLFQQYIRDQARMTGNPQRFLNMVHREDVVGGILAALHHGAPGNVYNLVDNEPVPLNAFFTWLAEKLGGDLPPVDPDGRRGRRKRPVTNKRVSNERLRHALGYSLRYPTFREGLQEEINKLQASGQLVNGRLIDTPSSNALHS